MKRCILFLALTFPIAAQQQEQPPVHLDTITVTAQKREENLQDVPISVTVVSGEKLEESGLSDLFDLSPYLPNFTIQEGTESTALTLRGIGNNGGTNLGFESSVGTFVDGIYHGRHNQSRMPYFDLERIEVLRGPQSTLFGMNTVAGAISMISRQPADRFEGNLQLSYDPQYDGRAASAAISVPLTDSFSARLALLKRRNEGYFHNTFLRRNVNGFDDEGARLTLRWAPASRWSAALKLERANRVQHGNSTQILTPPTDAGVVRRQRLYDPNATHAPDLDVSHDLELRDLDSNDVVLTVDYALNRFRLTSIASYSAFDGRTRLDVDMSSLPVSTLREHEDFSQRSLEFRITSDTGGPFESIAGLYYQSSDLTHVRLLDFALGEFLTVFAGQPVGAMQTYAGNFAQEFRTRAAFGELTWKPAARLRVTGGVRYNRERKHARSYFDWMVPGTTDPRNALDPASPEFALANFVFHDVFRIERHSNRGKYEHDRWLSELKLQWSMNDRTTVYASRTEGEKSGGFNDRDNRGTNFSFDPERSASYEVGAKLTSSGDTAQAAVALFRTEFEDMQVSVFDLPNLIFIVDNAAKALSEGIELEGRWRASRGVMLHASAGWLQSAKFVEFLVPCVAGPADPECMVRPGRDVRDEGGRDLSVPRLSGIVGATWRTALNASLDLMIGVDVSYRSSSIDRVNRSGRIDSASLVNARVRLGSQRGWSLAIIGNNLTDERFVALRGAALFAGSEYGEIRPPRTIRLQTEYRF